jgi:hypothetical protein
MTTTTIIDLPGSRALDYKAMSAMRGAGIAGDWVLAACVPYSPPVAPIVPVMNFYQTNYIAQNMTLQMQNICVNNLGAGAVIAVAGVQNSALTANASTAG